MQINHPSGAPDFFKEVGEYRNGNRSGGILLRGTEGAPDNYRLTCESETEERGDWKDWTAPRHRHAFEQIRYCISGNYSIGKDEVMPVGWVAYFPESAFYGPQVKGTDLTMLTLQYGGPSGLGYYSIPQHRKAFDDLLAAGGRFENGMYVFTDENGKRHQKDAAEAAWEKAMGVDKIEYPKSRYSEIILMNPDAFSWVKDPSLVGVARKPLGTFTERNMKIGFVHLDENAALPFGTERSAEILFLEEGSVRVGDEQHGRFSAFGTARDDAPEMLVATQECKLFYVKLPEF